MRVRWQEMAVDDKGAVWCSIAVRQKRQMADA